MLKAAREEKKSPLEIAEFYTKKFLEDFDRLNIDRPEIICKATEHIKEMEEFVQNLLEKDTHTKHQQQYILMYLN